MINLGIVLRAPATVDHRFLFVFACATGMNPDWRHIIPPGHEHVISEGHCVDDCTRKTFPTGGISIFAVVMQTHSIGKAVRLRQVRKLCWVSNKTGP